MIIGCSTGAFKLELPFAAGEVSPWYI
jgi:hypothetical protein